MNISKKEQIIIFLALITVILIIIIYKWVNYLSSNDYIQYVVPGGQQEGFSKGYISDGFIKTNYTVNLPLNSTYSCKNMCGPTARCSLTGQQCLADIDCPGCQPNVPPLKKTRNIPGDNDSGKLTNGVTPDYSPLTTDIGTQSATYNNNNSFRKTPGFANGVNTWRNRFDKMNSLFDSKFVTPHLLYMPVYSKRYSITGEFLENGPLPSNASLSNI